MTPVFNAYNRFGNLVVSSSRQYEDHYNPSDRFPFSYAKTTDHFTGKTDAILKRPETDPLVLHTQSASEYWVRRGSLVHTTTTGEEKPWNASWGVTYPPTIKMSKTPIAVTSTGRRSVTKSPTIKRIRTISPNE